MSSLGTALGSPNPARLLPARRSPEWRWYCRTIEDFSRCPGILSGRGAEWLWKKLQRSAPPPQISWGALLVGWGEADEARVRAALRETICLDDVVITSWNVRWLVDPNSTRATGKKRVIEERLALGQIVCIQETHWSDADEAVWKHGLMIRSIFASSAYNGDGQEDNSDTDTDDDQRGHQRRRNAGRAGRLGGVATLLPAGYKFIDEQTRVLVPGHATLATVKAPSGRTIKIVNTYLRPGSPGNTWDLVIDRIGEDVLNDPSTIFVGDFNTNLHQYNQDHSTLPAGPPRANQQRPSAHHTTRPDVQCRQQAKDTRRRSYTTLCVAAVERFAQMDSSIGPLRAHLKKNERTEPSPGPCL